MTAHTLEPTFQVDSFLRHDDPQIKVRVYLCRHPLLAGNWLLQNEIFSTWDHPGKKLVVIVGDEHAHGQMIANNRMGRQNSSLSYQLKKSAALLKGGWL